MPSSPMPSPPGSPTSRGGLDLDGTDTLVPKNFLPNDPISKHVDNTGGLDDGTDALVPKNLPEDDPISKHVHNIIRGGLDLNGVSKNFLPDDPFSEQIPPTSNSQLPKTIPATLGAKMSFAAPVKMKMSSKAMIGSTKDTAIGTVSDRFLMAQFSKSGSGEQLVSYSKVPVRPHSIKRSLLSKRLFVGEENPIVPPEGWFPCAMVSRTAREAHLSKISRDRISPTISRATSVATLYNKRPLHPAILNQQVFPKLRVPNLRLDKAMSVSQFKLYRKFKTAWGGIIEGYFAAADEQIPVEHLKDRNGDCYHLKDLTMIYEFKPLQPLKSSVRLFPKSSLDVPSICFDDVIEFQKTVNAITMGEKPVGCSVPGPTTSFVLGAIRAPNVQGVKRLNLISNNAPEGENGLLGGEKNLAGGQHAVDGSDEQEHLGEFALVGHEVGQEVVVPPVQVVAPPENTLEVPMPKGPMPLNFNFSPAMPAYMGSSSSKEKSTDEAGGATESDSSKNPAGVSESVNKWYQYFI